MFQGHDEDLAVSDLSRPRVCRDALDDCIRLIGTDSDFNLEFRDEAHGVFRAAVDFAMAFLSAKALCLGDGETFNSHCHEGFPNFVQLERLYDCSDQFHLVMPCLVVFDGAMINSFS
jgi:hypothetical protein